MPEIKGPDEDPNYWQEYGIVFPGGWTLHNLRTHFWPRLVGLDGAVEGF